MEYFRITVRHSETSSLLLAISTGDFQKDSRDVFDWICNRNLNHGVTIEVEK